MTKALARQPQAAAHSVGPKDPARVTSPGKATRMTMHGPARAHSRNKNEADPQGGIRAQRGMSVNSLRQAGRVAISGGEVIWVHEIPSSRWDLAIIQLRDAGSLVVLDGEVRIGLQRHRGFPGADGRIHVAVFANRDPDSLTQALASSDVAAGRAVLERASVGDARLQQMLREYGVVREYGFDYGHGALLVGDISDDWEVVLR